MSWILDFRYWIVDSLSVDLGFQIPMSGGIWIPWAVLQMPKPSFLDYTRFRTVLAKISQIPESEFPCIGRFRVNKRSPAVSLCSRLLDSRTRTTMSTRFDLKFFSRIVKKMDTPEIFIILFSPEKLALLSLLKEVEPSPDCKMLKLLTFDNLFPPLRHSR